MILTQNDDQTELYMNFELILEILVLKLPNRVVSGFK